MSHRLLSMVAAALLALGAPAAALAQSAGDEQYQDPLAGSEPEAAPPPPPASGSQGSGPPAAAQPAPAASAQAAPPPAAAGELPRTGGHEGWLAAAGLTLLAGGMALRRRVRVD